MDPLFAPPNETWQRLAPNYIRQRIVRSVITWLTVLAFAGTATWFLLPRRAAIITAIVIVVFGIWRVTRQSRLAHSWGYAERDTDLYITHGLMFKSLRVIPYGRMQSVVVTSGPVARLFNLASVELITASPASNATIPGVDQKVAEQLRDRLTEKGEQQAAGL